MCACTSVIFLLDSEGYRTSAIKKLDAEKLWAELLIIVIIFLEFLMFL